MPGIDEQIAVIESLIASFNVQEAEKKLRAIVYAIGKEELRIWEPDIRRTALLFKPKRRRAIIDELENKLNPSINSPGNVLASPLKKIDSSEISSLEKELSLGLLELSEHHIFQWSTFYRDFLGAFFNKIVERCPVEDALFQTSKLLRLGIAHHSHEIFNKGMNYVSTSTSSSSGNAVWKSLGGLQRFLELPIDFYSAKISAATNKNQAIAIRTVCSAMLAGILEGYGETYFVDSPGWKVLLKNPRYWTLFLGFFTKEDFGNTLLKFGKGTLSDSLDMVMLPTLGAIDELIAKTKESIALPALGQVYWEFRRFDISLRIPTIVDSARTIEIQCNADSSYINNATLQEAAARDVSLIVIPYRKDLFDFVSTHEHLKSITVFASYDKLDYQKNLRKIYDILEYALYKKISPRVASAALTYNFAREFPLHNPFLTKYFHVYRNSVRNLIRTFERRNGIRLWCSVRRSGKTTACFDLGATTGQSTVISQTCISIQQQPDTSIFHGLVSDAINSGKQIPTSFFNDAVAMCDSNRVTDQNRYIFVLDEYETLFGWLRYAARREPEFRYTIVQPLLNQMVAFSRENLLVFIGQQPNAHYILMDQNQLSAYVEQDSFPLFIHNIGSIEGEFVELLRKVLTDRVNFSSGFADLVYAETNGHPFLTVKLLVVFVDWLIKHKRQIRDLYLIDSDFKEFSKEKLTSAEISVNPEFSFFREAISQAISCDSKNEVPWLYAVYMAMRQTVLDSPKTLSCSRSDFASIVDKLDIYDSGITSDYILATSNQANFFHYSDSSVRPKIPLLGRITGITRPRIRP